MLRATSLGVTLTTKLTVIGSVGWRERKKWRVLTLSLNLCIGEDVGCSSQLASAAMSTTMSSLLILWLVAFIVQPAEGNSQTFPMAQCNDLEDRLDTFDVRVNLIQQNEKQQQDLQQKQQELIQEQQTQLKTLNETAEKQKQQLQDQQIQKLLAILKETGEQQQQQDKDMATLIQTVEQQKKQYVELQEQVTKQKKTVEEQEKGMCSVLTPTCNARLC